MLQCVLFLQTCNSCQDKQWLRFSQRITARQNWRTLRETVPSASAVSKKGGKILPDENDFTGTHKKQTTECIFQMPGYLCVFQTSHWENKRLLERSFFLLKIIHSEWNNQMVADHNFLCSSEQGILTFFLCVCCSYFSFSYLQLLSLIIM